MKKRIANCPACGGPVEFQLSTALVTICDFCHSVVARTDKTLEDHGKVADLVETNSLVKRGMSGVFEKKRFEVVGQVQYRHPAGGVWDEYYLVFPGDKVKWLASAQGKYYITFEKRLSENFRFPAMETLVPGRRFQMPDGGEIVVAEQGIATAISASGDIPWAFAPGAEHRFVDLQGPDREFATIEFEGDNQRFFRGREVSLDELHLSGDSWETGAPAVPNTKAIQLNCPQCAGPLTLHSPDQTLRVCCPSCKALLDCAQGKLEYLQTLSMKRKEKPLIPLGAVGRLSDVDYTVIGFMERYILYEDTKFRWTEYLLFNAERGFRWLVRSQGHWSFVEPVSVSDVARRHDRAIYRDQAFLKFDTGTAYVSYVAGEFYWRVTAGEAVDTTDYIAPPQMLSFEQSITEFGSELNVSLGTYLDKETVETAFGVTGIPAPLGVGTIQPATAVPQDIYLLWGGFSMILVLLDILFMSGFAQRPVSQFHFFLALLAISAWPLVMLINRRAFEVQRWRDSDFSPYAGSES